MRLREANRGEVADEQLLGSSDAEDFAVFYDRKVDLMLRFFQIRTACPQVAADLTAETFAQALGSRHRFDPASNASAWLFTIARRQLSSYRRRSRVATRARRRLRVPVEALTDEDLSRVEELVSFEALAPQIRDAAAGLSPPIQRAVLLRVVDGLPYAELAERLGCSPGTARVRVSRGLTKMAEELEGGLDDWPPAE